MQFMKPDKKVWPLARLNSIQLKARWRSLQGRAASAEEIAAIEGELAWRRETLPHPFAATPRPQARGRSSAVAESDDPGPGRYDLIHWKGVGALN